MTREISLAQSDADIEACFQVFSTLRPHIAYDDFLPQVRRQQAQGYAIQALRDDGRIKSVAGFRLLENLARGKVLYVDDLVTLPGETRQGYAGALLVRLAGHARAMADRVGA